jgi:hypothetical protein
VLFESPGAKRRIRGALGAVAELLQHRNTAAALERVMLVIQDAMGAVANPSTRDDVLGLLGALRASVEQQIANVAPVPVVVPIRDVVVKAGTLVRVPLDASRSEDPDSTPGTVDNIRRYRWYDDATGQLVGDGPVPVVELQHDGGSGVTAFTFRLDVEDSYGAVSSATTTINLVAEVAP